MYSRNCCYFLVLVLVIVQFGGNECYRSSSSRGSSRPSYRPSPSSRPSYRPSPHRPFPSPTHAPTYRPFPTHAPTHRPFPTHAPTHRPFPTHAPTYRPTYAPTFRPYTSHAPTYRPQPTHAPTFRPVPTHSPTYKPFPTHYPTQSPTYRPFPTHSPTYRPTPGRYPTYGPTRYPTQPTRYPTQPTRYPTQRYPVGPHPTYPGYGSGGVFGAGRPYQPSYTVHVPPVGGSRIKVYNVHNYHPATYWAPPSYPIYTYTHRDTGNSALGFYLGYSLGRISHPTYYHNHVAFYDGYNPRYDHYTVHHYYHNSETVPKQQVVTSNAIIKCGDSSQICPSNTTSLCTENGQIMCVVVTAQTVPCKDNPYLRCVQSRVPCENNEAPECKGAAKGQLTTINIPCISNTTIKGNFVTENNTIISADRHKNGTNSAVGITTLPPIQTTLPQTPTQNTVPQYCVTIIAEPTKRDPTEGERVFKEVTNVFEAFFSKAFGVENIRPK